jgi:hypothetical protein
MMGSMSGSIPIQHGHRAGVSVASEKTLVPPSRTKQPPPY